MYIVIIFLVILSKPGRVCGSTEKSAALRERREIPRADGSTHANELRSYIGRVIIIISLQIRRLGLFFKSDRTVRTPPGPRFPVRRCRMAPEAEVWLRNQSKQINRVCVSCMYIMCTIIILYLRESRTYYTHVCVRRYPHLYITGTTRPRSIILYYYICNDQ